MRKKGLCMAATLLATAVSHLGCSTDTSPSGNTAAGQQSSAVQTGETIKKETDTSNEKETSAQDGGNKIVNVSGYLIGYSQLADTRTHRIAEIDSMKDETEERGFRLIVTDTQDNTAKRVSDVENLIAQNIDLLALLSRESKGLKTALQTTKENPILVILVDRLAKGEAGVDYVTYIATGFTQEGQVAGEQLRDKTEGTCNITKLTGTVGSSSAQNRVTGFAGVIDQNEGMKIIASQTGNFKRSEGQKVMENLLQAHGGEVDAVLYHNDQMASGAVQATKAAGYRPNEDVLAIGIDGEMDSSKSVITGEMSATVVSSPTYGPIALGTVEKILAGQEVPEQIIMEGMVVDAGDAQEDMELAY